LIDLTDGMGPYRVIDRQAIINAPAFLARLRISNQLVERRVIEAPAVIALIQECENGLPGIDRWQSEGDIGTVTDTWTMVALYGGDVKCSASTWWNTGNPRNLLERWLLSVTTPRKSDGPWGPPLWEWLGERFQRCTYATQGLPPGRWFKAAWSDIADAVLTFLSDGGQLSGGSTWRLPPSDPRSMVYLMAEAGTDWIKVGACKANGTSPPERRRCMYQPGNRRQILVASAWSYAGTNPENAMKAALRELCNQSGQRYRAEWFNVGIEAALAQLRAITSRPDITAISR
jgi:hypothetical protein